MGNEKETGGLGIMMRLGNFPSETKSLCPRVLKDIKG